LHPQGSNHRDIHCNRTSFVLEGTLPTLDDGASFDAALRVEYLLLVRSWWQWIVVDGVMMSMVLVELAMICAAAAEAEAGQIQTHGYMHYLLSVLS